MGFRIIDRDERRRSEEAYKIVSSHVERHRSRSGGFVDYDEALLQQELIQKVNRIRRQFYHEGGDHESVERLKDAIKTATVAVDTDSLFHDLEPHIILDLI